MQYSYGGKMDIAKECKRDLEGDAKRLKKRIDTFSAMRDATEAFVKEGYLYWFEENAHRTAMMVVIAGLGMEIPALQDEYDSILTEIEKER